MSKIRIIYNNVWRRGEIYAHGSEHPQFPAEDTQADTPSQFWRTRYGIGTGNGWFQANTTNDKINFNEGGGNLTATIAANTYSGLTLANAVEAALEDAGALEYTVGYNESAALFTITANANFTLQWANGANAANSAANLLGYNSTEDDTGNNSFVGDYRRIHTHAYLRMDLGSNQEVNFMALLNHGISANYTALKYVGADANNFSGNLETENLTYNPTNLFHFFSASMTHRYVQLTIADATNPNSYIQLGPVILGKYWEPNYTFAREYTQGRVDDSVVDESYSLVEYAQARPTRRTWNLPFPLGLTQTDADKIVDFFDTVGLKYGFVVCFDSNSANTTSYFVKNAELSDPIYRHVNSWQWQLNIREKL